MRQLKLLFLVDFHFKEEVCLRLVVQVQVDFGDSVNGDGNQKRRSGINLIPQGTSVEQDDDEDDGEAYSHHQVRDVADGHEGDGLEVSQPPDKDLHFAHFMTDILNDKTGIYQKEQQGGRDDVDRGNHLCHLLLAQLTALECREEHHKDKD